MTVHLPAAVPEIPVTDVAASVAYYRDVLGFTSDWSDEQLGLAGISRGDCRVFLASEGFRRGYGNVGPALTWLNLTSVEQVDDLFRTWSSNGAKIIAPPESKPWGLHEFTAIDPDGNLFRVFYDFGTANRVAAER